MLHGRKTSAPAPDALGAFFTPRSVAVVGASSDPSKFGSKLLTAVIKSGFGGDIFPISRGEAEIQGCRAHRSLTDIGAPVDLVLISIPASAVPEAVGEAQAAGARAAVAYASGFGESDAAGRGLQEQLIARLREGGMRMIGPNCMGVRSFTPPMNAANNPPTLDQAGPIALLSQSGSFGHAAYASFKSLRIGLSRYASLGNMVDVTHADMIEYCGRDEATGVIAAFVEGIPDMARLLDVITDVSPRKPVVILKAGVSPLGARAALSHTGSLATDARTVTSLLSEAGATVVETMQEFFDTAAAFGHAGTRLPSGKRSAVFAVSGGPSVVTADHCHVDGIELPPLAESLAHLRPMLPTYAAIGNPVEITGSARRDAYVKCGEALAGLDVIDSVIAVSIGLDMPEFGQAMVVANAAKPVIGSVTGPKLMDLFAENRIPNYPSPERAVRSLKHLAARAAHLTAPLARAVKGVAAGNPSAGNHGEAATKRFLASYGMPVTAEKECRSLESAVSAAAGIGYPVALKVSSASVLHKTERGGVMLGIADEGALKRAWQQMLERFPGEAMLVQQMAAPGVELILGGRRTAGTVPIVVIGLGGVMTELLDDVVIRRAPAAPEAVLRALARLKHATLLDGFRGGPKVDRESIARIASLLSAILAANPGIREIDINPLMVCDQSAVVVDALMVVGDPS